MPLQPGNRFGRYELVELLGKGGMGEVYRAQDTLLHRRVALKVLHPLPSGTGGGSSQTDGAARILREARASAAIEHPNAIAIYDVGEVDGVPFLAMEFVPGKTLRHFIADRTVTLARRIRWLVDIARAIGAAHALGLVHRDIKPENIMVRDDGVVKVLDFGIARRTAGNLDPNALTGALPVGTMTGEGVVVGTPFYMAPEQMRGEPLDGRADQFAWGVLAYELLTGVLPWDRDAEGLQLVAQILSGEPQAPRARNPEIPVPVDGAIRMALSKVAGNRFAQMEDIAETLEPHAAAAGASTGSSEVRRSNPLEEISLAPTQAAPSAGTSNVPSTRTQLATPPAAPSPARARVGWRAVVVTLALVLVAGLGGLRVTAGRRAEKAAPPDASMLVRPESRMSDKPEATAAYRAGMQALRDGSLQSAIEQFERAIELDPRFAAANLRFALLGGGELQTRKPLQSARSAREDLGEHDRILLDAVEPWTRFPPDMKESQRRLEAAMKQDPASADFAFQLGLTLDNANAYAEAAAAFDAAIARDPTFALAWHMKARELVNLDDLSGAMDAYDRCLKISPAALSCLDDLSTLQANEGKCGDMATTVRRLIAVAPDEPRAYGRLAQALFSTGEPVDAVRAALAQKWDRLPEAAKPMRLLDEAALAILTGHFDEAETADREFDRKVALSGDDRRHFLAAYDRVLVNVETGRSGEALRVANDYLRSRSAWQADSLAIEPTIAMYAAELEAGGLTSAEFGKARDGWLKRDRERVERVGFVSASSTAWEWIFAYALPAMTPEDGAAAVASRPGAHPLVDAMNDAPYAEEPVGRTYLLAGRLDDAATALTRASESCAVLETWAPVFSTWAAFELGQALEKRGDTRGACSAYRRVLARWGAAKPSSGTATKARARARALLCEP